VSLHVHSLHGAAFMLGWQRMFLAYSSVQWCHAEFRHEAAPANPAVHNYKAGLQGLCCELVIPLHDGVCGVSSCITHDGVCGVCGCLVVGGWFSSRRQFIHHTACAHNTHCGA
jgi:hypothetical protein